MACRGREACDGFWRPTCWGTLSRCALRPTPRQRARGGRAGGRQALEGPNRFSALGFRMLVLPRAGYIRLMGDPFAVADHFPPDWSTRGELPSLTWPEDRGVPPRTVEDVRQVLQRTKS